MNLDQIETKCFILALFIRDDGERFLLGSRAYEFVDSQLHFVANSYQNDIVEVQGNDGVMLAGQVRRGTSQPFDGYIGDQTVDRTTIEQYRRDFMKFFRKNHYYKVVYVFPDGSAVQRRNGFIVEAPEVKELYQLFPQYHISMNFEDINYYVYEEDSEGEEIYGESATLKIATSATGGLIWEEGTESEISGEGSQFTLQDTIDGNVLDSVQLKGDTTQQTYSGKNLINPTTLESGVISGESGEDMDNVNRVRISSAGAIPITGGSTYTVSTSAALRVALYAYNGSTFITGWGGSWVPVSSMPYTFTTPSNATKLRIAFSFTDNTRIYVSDVTNPQLELGSSATSYEPYVGGIPAPNPDYPQTVNTVTGRQVVEVYGKNLFNGEVEQGTFNNQGQKTASTTKYRNVNPISVSASTQYTFSATGITAWDLFMYDSNQSYIGYGYSGTGTYTFGANVAYVNFAINAVNGVAPTNIQLELGSSATPYESRQSYEVNLGKNLLDPSILIQGDITGGTSTNRVCTRSGDDIHVSGGDTYTISVSDIALQVNVYGYKSINGTAIYDSGWQSMPFTFELPSQANYLRLMFRYSNDSDIVPSDITCQLEKGSQTTTYSPYFEPIELCKIGTYQDYIYKSGDDWYVHKECRKVTLDGSESIERLSFGTNTYGVSLSNLGGGDSDINVISDCFYGISFDNRVTSQQFVVYRDANRIDIRNTTWSTDTDFKTWLATNKPSIYHKLGSSAITDTQITDSSLVAQFEALLGATTYDGQTAFTVSSENQLAILDVTVIARTGGGVVWDNYGAEWEEGTGGGPTMVNVDSIDNVYPVLTLTGPAVNPQISVLTTNTTLSYSGTVTASQELKIDMFNKTATLNGASVVGNVSGDWVYLKPGVNRITYTTNNADAPDSTIWWQEIVG